MKSSQSSASSSSAKRGLRPLPAVIFASRWLQLPLYLGLIVAQAVYVFHFWVELAHLIEAAFGSSQAVAAIATSVQPCDLAVAQAKGTPTLPPAAFTNTFLLGQDELVLIDPATPFPDEQKRLLAALDAVAAQGARIRAIWLTHHHADHIGAVELCRRHLGVPVLAHPATAAKLAAWGIEVDEHLNDGDRIELGGDPPFTVRVLHTPGHTRGHLSFLDEKYGSLITGDLLSTLSTIVIDPPEGDMDDYLDSLEKVAGFSPRALFPSHGPLVLSAMARLEGLHRHRLAREEKVLAAWQEGKKTPAAMVAEVYDDTPPALHPVAERQIAAHLIRLEKAGRLT